MIKPLSCMPTTKTCNEICRMITGNGCNTWGRYVQTLFDPHQTHGLYGILQREVDSYKSKIKAIGGKNLRVVKGKNGSDYAVICFRLDASPEEIAAKKLRDAEEQRWKEAFESKLQELKISPILISLGATNEDVLKCFARALMDGTLDSNLPFEHYAVLDDAHDKDEKRILDIIKKGNEKFPTKGCVGLVTTRACYSQMIALAERMNKSITDEAKRIRRRAACLSLGAKFLAECFKKAAS